MKILVIDDNKDNQASAKVQLADHETTVVGSYEEGRDLLQRRNPGFEVILVDLLMPASERAQGPNGKRFVGQEMPIGIFLALLATKSGGIKYVALLTDSNHHDHPASACLDPFGDDFITVNDTKVLLSNNGNFIGSFQPNDGPCVRAKNWLKLFDYLTGNVQSTIGHNVSGPI